MVMYFQESSNSGSIEVPELLEEALDTFSSFVQGEERILFPWSILCSFVNEAQKEIASLKPEASLNR